MSTEVSEVPSTTTTTAKKGTGKRPPKRPSTGGDDASAASSSTAPKVKKSNRAAKAESSAPVHTEEKPEITPLPEHMDPPSEAEYKNQLTKLDGELKTISDKIDRLVGGAIQQKIEERRSAHEGFLQLLEKVKAIRANRQALFEEGNKYKAQLDSVTGGRQAQKAKLQGIEKELKYKTIEDLEAAIKELEYKVQTTTMPLAVEKKCLDEIRRLKNQRETVAHFSKEREVFRETKVDTTDVRQAMGKAFEGAKAFKAEEEKLSKELDALKDKEKAAEKAIADFHEQKTALQEKRKEINKTINRTHIAHEKALRLYQKWQNFQSKKAREAEREKKKEEWEKKKADREKAKQEYEERKKRREERQKEWEERKKQQAEERALAKAFYEEQKRMEAEIKEAEEAAKDPWEKEKFMCDDIEKYLKRLAGEKIDMNEETKSDVDSDLKLVKAEERMNDFKGKSVKAEVQNKGKKLPEHALFALKKKEAKLEAQKKAAEKTKPADRALTHVPFTLASFRSIQIDPPKFLSEVAATLKAVQERREYYNTAPRPDKKKKNQSTIEEVDHAIAADHALTESENDDNRTKSAAMADQLAEEERQRQISEEEAVIEEEKKEREEARRKSIAASELEQLRRVQEIAEQKAAAATEEQEERKKNQELADLAFEKEKADRIAADELAVKQAEDERAANQAIANELEDKEKERRIAEEKSNSEQVAELKEKARKLSVDLVNSDALKQMVEKQENKRESSE